jgi:CHAT domain-containing protein/tetratricopeptide (TPR) repeat protein
MAAAAALPFKPIPAYSPELQAQREAAVFKKDGERLREEGRIKEARGKWLAAVEAYRRAGYRFGEGVLLLQIGYSYQPEMESDPEAMAPMISFIAQGASVQADFLADVADSLDPADRSSFREADDLLRRASSLAEGGDCASALPLFEAAGQRYGEVVSGAGELRALSGRLRCGAGGTDLFGALAVFTAIPELGRIAESLKDRTVAGPFVRYLKAVEHAELGEWQPAEELLQTVLRQFEQLGDALNAGRAALDLGSVLAQTGRPEEAEALYRRAGQLLSGLDGPEAFRNQAAVRRNLAGIPSVPHWLDAVVTASPVKQPVEEVARNPRPPGDAGLTPRARARREAIFLLADGDRLKQSGSLKAAKEKWLAAVDLYQQAEDPEGLWEAYRRLVDTYAGADFLDRSWGETGIDLYLKMAAAAADAYESSVGKELPLDREALAQADTLRQKATLLSASGSCSQAVPLLQESRRLYQRAGLAIGEIRTLLLEAHCLMKSGDVMAGLMKIGTMISMTQSLPEGAAATELENQANNLFDRGRWREAREAYEDLLCRSERDRNLQAIGEALLGLGKTQFALGSNGEAETALQTALGFLPLLDEESGKNRETFAREKLGAVYFRTGRIEEGIAELRKARDSVRQAGRPEREVTSLRRLGDGLAEIGEYSEALAALDEAEELQEQLPIDLEIAADLALSRGQIEFLRGQLQDALKQLIKSEELYEQAHEPRRVSEVRLLLAGIQSALGRNEEALALYQKLNVGGSQEDAGFLSQFARAAELPVLLQQEKFQDMAELCNQLLPSLEQSGPPELEALIRNFLGMSYFYLGRADEAREQLDRAARAARAPTFSQDSSGVPPGFAGYVTVWGELSAKIYELQEALKTQGEGSPIDESHLKALLDDFGKSLRESMQIMEAPGPTMGMLKDLGLQSFKFLERYASLDPQGSLYEIDETLGLLDRWAGGLTLGELKAPFLEQFSLLYSHGVELSLASHQPNAAFRYAEEARARAFTDQIGNQKIDARRGADPDLLREEWRLRLQLSSLKRDLHAEQQKPLDAQSPERLENLQRSIERVGKEWEYFQVRLKAMNPEYASLVAVDPLGLEEVQEQVLDGETTLVEYFLADTTGDPAFAWVIERERFVMEKLPVTAADLRTRVAELRDLIESRQPFRAQAAALYRDLFATLTPHIHHRNVVIVPHGVLHFLPFAALWDEKERRYLGDTYTLSYSPSATVLKFARERKAAAIGPVLIAGDPDGSLPHAAEEARAVARLYGAEPLVGSAATEGTVAARAGEAGILHLAAHAMLNPINPLFTKIELAPDEGHDGSLEMHEVFGLDLSKTGLVVLSGCSTQMGRLTAGDEIEGLTRAFLYAGTPAVMASLWKVDDESTSFLMKHFYTHLRKGRGRAEALRRAQAETRRKFPHPYQWAAFVLTGDGR